MPTIEQLEAQAREALEPLEGLAVAVLFGSRARGDARDQSDLDVAIIPATDDPTERRRLRNRVGVALADLAPEGRVDVVLLDDAPVLLRQRVMEDYRMVLCRDFPTWRDLRVATMREWGDMEYYRNMYVEAQKKRLAEGKIGGGRPRALESLERARELSD